MKGLRSISILAALALCLSAHAQDSTATAPIRYPRVYDYHTDRGPTKDLKALDNTSCAPIHGIDSTVTAYMNLHGIVGASIAVMRNDSLLYVRGYGWADKEAGQKMEPWHRMRIASVSKLVTAIGIMKMEEMGLLSLQDKPLAEGGVLHYLVPTHHDARLDSVTVEHLLRHQAGFTTERGDGDPMFHVGMTDGDEACRTDLGKPLLYSPGTDQEYSNVGYYLLGVMIRRISGQSYGTWMKENVLNPMQCYNFDIAGNYCADRKEREVHYYMHPGAKTDEDFHGDGTPCEACYGGNNVTGVEGAGAWMSTAPELCRMVAGINIESGIYDLLDRRSVEEMTRYISKEIFSLGWLDTNEEGIWTRTGSFGGTTAMVKYFSADGDCWVLLTNTSTCFGSKVAKYSSALIEELRGKYLGNLGKEDLFY